MATGRIDRTDDTAAVLKIIATVSGTEDAVTKQWQAVVISDSTDPVANKLAISAGGAASVAGTVTANLSATDNAVRDAIELAPPPLAGAVSGTEMQVDVLTLPAITGTVTANLSATDNAVLDAIEADTTTIAGAVSGSEMQVDVLTMPAIDTELTTADLDTGAGTDTRAVVGLVGSASGGGGLIPASATDGPLANLGANNDGAATLAAETTKVIGTVTIAAAQTLAPVTTVSTLTGGAIAHDAADSGNPHKIGAKVETSPKGITLAADADRTDLYADADGLLMVKLNTSLADVISERVTDTAGTSAAFTTFGAVASTKNYVTSIALYNSSATNGFVDFRDGTAGAVLWTMPLPTLGGSVISSAVPLFKTSANTALAYDVSEALTTVYISISGFQSKV